MCTSMPSSELNFGRKTLLSSCRDDSKPRTVRHMLAESVQPSGSVSERWRLGSGLHADLVGRESKATIRNSNALGDCLNQARRTCSLEHPSRVSPTPYTPPTVETQRSETVARSLLEGTYQHRQVSIWDDHRDKGFRDHYCNAVTF